MSLGGAVAQVGRSSEVRVAVEVGTPPGGAPAARPYQPSRRRRATGSIHHNLPHASHLTPLTSRLSPHASHLSPHAPRLTPLHTCEINLARRHCRVPLAPHLTPLASRLSTNAR
ncbi:MAG: hypothetical protein KatS3mg058_1511 [Roseiflexus sp.]|nr:MAG: hypothetical protein KatS3mg058_1511 [Roseiflexus sp.]